ncbi:MAG: hypothetical protein KAT14_01930 [Candidatus Marinimicrobia bacterium]|nr:hypothetical protein [Candidatus Neomarinimicrobiota bacterium]
MSIVDCFETISSENTLFPYESVIVTKYLPALLNLEIKGYITVKPGNYYIRNI